MENGNVINDNTLIFANYSLDGSRRQPHIYGESLGPLAGRESTQCIILDVVLAKFNKQRQNNNNYHIAVM